MEVSKWANTQATREVHCPRCKQTAGDSCRTPGGRPTQMGPHVERLIAYRDKIGFAEFKARHSGGVNSGVLSI